MATIEIEIDGKKIQELLQSDRGMTVLLKPILNQILQAEMSEHLGAEPEERTSYATRLEARPRVFDFAEEWYNPHRLHSALTISRR